MDGMTFRLPVMDYPKGRPDLEKYLVAWYDFREEEPRWRSTAPDSLGAAKDRQRRGEATFIQERVVVAPENREGFQNAFLLYAIPTKP